MPFRRTWFEGDGVKWFMIGVGVGMSPSPAVADAVMVGAVTPYVPTLTWMSTVWGEARGGAADVCKPLWLCAVCVGLLVWYSNCC